MSPSKLAAQAPEHTDAQTMHGILTAYLQSKAAFQALEIGLFESVERRPATAAELAAELGLAVRPIRALLIALLGLGLVERDDQDRYASSAMSSRFLVEGGTEFMGGFARHQNSHFAHFSNLDEAVRSNASLNRRVRSDGYQDQGAADGEGRAGTTRLIQAMRVSSRLQADQFGCLAPLEGVNHILDLGCGSGDYSIALAKHHPGCRITSLDYPAVAVLAAQHVADADVEDRVSVRAADILRDEWPASDAVLLSHVLDGYGDVRAEGLVKKVYDHLPAGGRLLVHSHMPSLATGLFPSMFGLILLVNTDEGEVRDSPDIKDWLSAAGFSITDERNVSPLSGLVVAEKV